MRLSLPQTRPYRLCEQGIHGGGDLLDRDGIDLAERLFAVVGTGVKHVELGLLARGRGDHEAGGAYGRLLLLINGARDINGGYAKRLGDVDGPRVYRDKECGARDKCFELVKIKFF